MSVNESLDALVTELGCTNVRMLGTVPLEDLPAEIARAGVCLGIFGTSAKAARVVPHKVYECMAMGRPVVTAGSPAVRRLLGDSVATVPAGDERALAESVRALVVDDTRRERLARSGRERFEGAFSEEVLAARLRDYLLEAAGR